MFLLEMSDYFLKKKKKKLSIKCDLNNQAMVQEMDMFNRFYAPFLV